MTPQIRRLQRSQWSPSQSQVPSLAKPSCCHTTHNCQPSVSTPMLTGMLRPSDGEDDCQWRLELPGSDVTMEADKENAEPGGGAWRLRKHTRWPSCCRVWMAWSSTPCLLDLTVHAWQVLIKVLDCSLSRLHANLLLLSDRGWQHALLRLLFCRILGKSVDERLAEQLKGMPADKQRHMAEGG